MKNLSFKLAFVAIASLGVILSSCNTTIEVAKRKHRKGYHVSISKNNQEFVAKQSLAEAVEFANVDSPAVDTVKSEHLLYNIDEVTASANVDSPAVDTVETEHLFNEVTAFANVDSPAVDTVKTEHFNQEVTASNSRKKMSFGQKLKTVRNLKKQLKQLKQEGFKTAEDDDSVMLLIYLLLAIFLPPLAVFLLKDLGVEFWISLLLTLLFWLPGIIYAILVVFGKI